MRIGIGIASLTMSVLFIAQTFGLVPDVPKAILDGRKVLCENVAVECSLAAQHDGVPVMKAVLTALKSRDPAILSGAVRRTSGKLLAEVGAHQAAWDAETGEHSPGTHVEVPIFQGKQRWGTVEIRFTPLEASGWRAWLVNPNLRLIAFVTSAGFLLHLWYLKRTLRHLDPSSVIPDRVRATLDTLAEGVLVLNREQRIVLANKAFAESTGHQPDQLQGMRADSIPWSQSGAAAGAAELPWQRAIREGVAQTGVMLGLEQKSDQKRQFTVNTMPIHDANGRRRGALVTFDDVTSIEEKNAQLEVMLHDLQSSRDEIRRQNEELTVLATCDPLTACLNRRAFFSQFQTQWEAAALHDRPLSCLMVDIDHFKSVNDRFGHATGDAVLQQVGATLRKAVREADLVCRYGGEEFCVLLPATPLAAARRLAEALRAAVAAIDGLPTTITASFGVSAFGNGAAEPHQVLDQADKALYAAKRSGRNRVTSWTELTPEQQVQAAGAEHDSARRVAADDVPIPFHAVAALTAALAYRDARTAEHSRRVADLCVLIGRGLMSERDCYVLEVAALLHDIGKLGIPDEVLLKPGPLNEEEWKLMNAHDRISVNIIRTAFSSPELAEIIGLHHLRYDGAATGGGSPRSQPQRGEAIPLRARILSVADAYDAIVSDRVYRKHQTREQAFAELRRCAGKQFDPQIVERLVQVVSSNDQGRAEISSSVSKQAALRIGLQIECLAEALDAHDFANLSTMAGRLASTAANDGVPEIAALAEALQASATADADILQVVSLTSELLDLCRATQSSHLAPSR